MYLSKGEDDLKMTKLNKKGFTLVELLAVIAILAILMLLITPNVLKMFTDGKKDVFSTQVQRIWKAADSQYITDSMKGNTPGTYCYEGPRDSKEDREGENKLSVSESNLMYYIHFNADGDVDVLKVSDGDYYYDSSKEGFTLSLDKTDGKAIEANPKAKLTCSSGELVVTEKK